MNCEEKDRLLREYEAATVAFSAAVKELRLRMGTSPKEEYNRLAQRSNEDRVKSEGARLALEQHVATWMPVFASAFNRALKFRCRSPSIS